jgi:hypothetical protein
LPRSSFWPSRPSRSPWSWLGAIPARSRPEEQGHEKQGHEKQAPERKQEELLRNFLLVVWDGDRMRAFHPPVMDPFDRQMVEEVSMRLLGRADELFRGTSPRTLPPPHPPPPNGTGQDEALLTTLELARLSGYSGDACQKCHGLRVRRTGTCLTCEDCDSNEGCG